MDKRYQVFVSSTYADLEEERQEVMQALLELDCIPAGMELFPAANEDQWTLIKKVIDDCDYYMVILAGRYGSIGPDGSSYTEMEYRYALKTGKPVLGFVHRTPELLAAIRCEATDEGKAKLIEFRKFVQEKMCRYWDSPSDLGSQVSRSLVKLIKNNPGVGWVRGNLVPDEGTVGELLRLRNRIDELQADLQAARTQAPEGAANLAQGFDILKIRIAFDAVPDALDRLDPANLFKSFRYTDEAVVTWNDIFFAVSPLMIHEATEDGIKSAITNLATRRSYADLKQRFKGSELSNFEVVGDDFQTIKVQLRALGLITKSTKSRSVKDAATYWTLTPYGDDVMTKLRAIPKP